MQGLLLQALITPADVQDRDGGVALLSTLFGMFPFLTKLFADSAYQGPIFHTALASILPNLESEIVRRSDAAKGFAASPKRWIVESGLSR
jgi:transposase